MAKRFRKPKEWSSVVERWKLSGLSVKNFCQMENVGEGRFYEMRKQLQTGINKRSNISKPLFLPVQIKKEQEILLPVTDKSVLMEVTLSNGFYLRFPSSIGTHELTRITKSLSEQQC